ncbi:hypothetical protein ODS41_05555 [Pyrobaculum sp. 3827-6]|uniref:hypothetical protein n=1 Tax=Pyrobaculum sp. 3827-6 TaxID=2983604 RepID=UPI0021D88F3A|nr:hypothetical protein [Pyrobaculum sp. 3827-6]MCU7787384.1 hypothetical protein [Pyrobaculum sp. 3827-6]
MTPHRGAVDLDGGWRRRGKPPALHVRALDAQRPARHIYAYGAVPASTDGGAELRLPYVSEVVSGARATSS